MQGVVVVAGREGDPSDLQVLIPKGLLGILNEEGPTLTQLPKLKQHTAAA